VKMKKQRVKILDPPEVIMGEPTATTQIKTVHRALSQKVEAVNFEKVMQEEEFVDVIHDFEILVWSTRKMKRRNLL